MNQDFKELLEAFNAEKVKYLIVGGFAVIVHTEPRTTKDIDLWIATDSENAQRVYSALKKFGAPVSTLKPADFAQEGFLFTMGIAPNRIEVIMGLKGVDFNDYWVRRSEGDFAGVPVSFISAEDLLENKLAVGRY